MVHGDVSSVHERSAPPRVSRRAATSGGERAVRRNLAVERSGEEPRRRLAIDHVTRSVAVSCAPGDRTRGVRRRSPSRTAPGVNVPEGTTHLPVTGRDDYRVAIGVRAALEGLPAVARNGTPLSVDGTARRPYGRRGHAPSTAWCGSTRRRSTRRQRGTVPDRVSDEGSTASATLDPSVSGTPRPECNEDPSTRV
jgi:hypothetical protein